MAEIECPSCHHHFNPGEAHSPPTEPEEPDHPEILVCCDCGEQVGGNYVQCVVGGEILCDRCDVRGIDQFEEPHCKAHKRLILPLKRAYKATLVRLRLWFNPDGSTDPGSLVDLFDSAIDGATHLIDWGVRYAIPEDDADESLGAEVGVYPYAGKSYLEVHVLLTGVTPGTWLDDNLIDQISVEKFEYDVITRSLRIDETYEENSFLSHLVEFVPNPLLPKWEGP